MTKITLTDLANLQNENTAVSAINNNNATLETFSDSVLSRDGTSPNEMEAALDMNSHQILNLPSPVTDNSPLRLKDLEDFVGGSLTLSPLPQGGASGQVLTKISATDYDANWQSPQPDDYFYLSNYASLQAACDATVANGGGIVFCDVPATLTGSPGLNLNNWITPLKITGFSAANGGAAFGSVITYTGAGTAISATTSVSITLDSVYITATQGGTLLVDMATGAYNRIRNCIFYHQVDNTSNIGIRLGGLGDQGTIIEECTFVPNSGTGVIGVTSNFSVAAQINNNKFTTTTRVAVSAPGQAWRITGNLLQGNNLAAWATSQKLVEVGPAGTCDTLYLNGNDCDDTSVVRTWVESNAGCLISVNNRYTGTLTTAIAQTNSTGAVISIGDYFQGAVGVNIGTGNYLSINTPNQAVVPAAYFTGTPASSRVNHIFGSLAQVTSQMLFGISGSVQGSARWLNTAGGSNTLIGQVLAGSFTNTIPATTGTLLNDNNTITSTNKTFTSPVLTTPAINGTSTGTGVATANTASTLVLRDGSGNFAAGTITASLSGTATNASNIGIVNDTTTNATVYPIWAVANSGNRVPNVTSTKLTYNPNTDVFTVGGMSFGNITGAAGLYFDGTNTALRGVVGQSIFFQSTAGSSWASINSTTLTGFGGIRSPSATAGIGYSTGAGGSVTQITSKSTGVTLNNICGQVIMHNASLAAGASVGFVLTNSAIVTGDIVIPNIKSGGAGSTVDAYDICIDNISTGSCRFSIRNRTAGALGESVVIGFAVIKGVTS